MKIKKNDVIRKKVSTFIFIVGLIVSYLAVAPDAPAETDDDGDLLLTINNPTPEVGDAMGRAVAALGDNILVGAEHDNTGAPGAGSVYLFDGQSGELLLTINNPTPEANDFFGMSVTTVGNNVLVGAPFDNAGADSAGSVYLFDGTTGDLLLTINNPTPAVEDFFGWAIAAYGDDILVGAYRDDTGAVNTGSAYLFDGTTGELLLTLNNPTPAPNEEFGVSVTALDNQIVVGARFSNQFTGSVYVFDGPAGNLLLTIHNPTPETADVFGEFLATMGNKLLVTDVEDRQGAVRAGSIFVVDGLTGEILLTISNPTPEAGDWFGSSVAAIGEKVVVGAQYDNTGATGAGSAYVYDGITGELLLTINNPTPDDDDKFGLSVAQFGSDILVGALHDGTGAPQAGTAYLFSGIEPVGSAGIITFQYTMNDGSSGAGTYYLSDNSTFVDDTAASGVWSFNPANNRYFIYYNSGAHCGAFSVGVYNGANQIPGLRVCTDGSGAQGYWFGILSNGVTARVSVASDGAQADGNSYAPTISADGRYVTFATNASNLVSGDTNGTSDVFVHDQQTEQTTRASVASDGTQGNGISEDAAISADGRYVVFESLATNLVSGDTNGKDDIFVHDRQTGQTSRVSINSNGTQGNGDSEDAAISADGRYVVFASLATNLVSGDTNAVTDIFVYDRQTGQTSRVSVASDGTQGDGVSEAPDISAGGRYVAFASWANNLVSGDTNNTLDVFIHDLTTAQTSRVSVASDGTEGNDSSRLPAISADGRYVAFESWASNLVSGDTNFEVDIFVHDRQTGQTSLVSVASDGAQGNFDHWDPDISADGRHVAFYSFSDNLVSGDTNGVMDVFVHDLATAQTSRVSLSSTGIQGIRGSRGPAISAGGRYVAFESEAPNLVGGDTNGGQDIFIRDREP